MSKSLWGIQGRADWVWLMEWFLFDEWFATSMSHFHWSWAWGGLAAGCAYLTFVLDKVVVKAVLAHNLNSFARREPRSEEDTIEVAERRVFSWVVGVHAALAIVGLGMYVWQIIRGVGLV